MNIWDIIIIAIIVLAMLQAIRKIRRGGTCSCGNSCGGKCNNHCASCPMCVGCTHAGGSACERQMDGDCLARERQMDGDCLARERQMDGDCSSREGQMDACKKSGK